MFYEILKLRNHPCSFLNVPSQLQFTALYTAELEPIETSRGGNQNGIYDFRNFLILIFKIIIFNILIIDFSEIF